MYQTTCLTQSPLTTLERAVLKRIDAGLVCSLGLLLYDDRGCVLMIRENKESPIKRRGDYSVPWETWEPGKSLEVMRQQACDEETGMGVVHASPEILLPGLPVADTFATVLMARFIRAESFRGTAVASGELMEPGSEWIDPKRFFVASDGLVLSPTPLPARVGIREILTAFMNRWQ